jgi:RNA polymerase sigma-70 factor (ECF subfamily)
VKPTLPAAVLREAAAGALRRFGLEVDADRLVALVEPWPSAVSGAAVERLEELVVLAACAGGDERGVICFDRAFLAPAVAKVSAPLRARLGEDELPQAARLHLLVGTAGAQRLRQWTGAAPLGAWVRAVVTRLALDLGRGERAALDQDEAEAAIARLPASTNPEYEALRGSHRAQMGQALREALERLPRRERTVLRLHVFQGLSAEQVGRVFHVDATTVRRWIRGAREVVLAGVRERLTTTWKLSPSQVDSVVAGVGTSLELSLSGLEGGGGPSLPASKSPGKTDTLG